MGGLITALGYVLAWEVGIEWKHLGYFHPSWMVIDVACPLTFVFLGWRAGVLWSWKFLGLPYYCTLRYPRR